jgi:hypothetical protein
MTAFRRPLVAWVAMLGIVFSQLAVAAYACPFLSLAGGPQRMEVMTHGGGMPCAETGEVADHGQAALCVQHCQPDGQAVGSVSPPDFQPALLLPLVVPMLSLAEDRGASYVQASLLARITSPPPLWRTGRLRI